MSARSRNRTRTRSRSDHCRFFDPTSPLWLWLVLLRFSIARAVSVSESTTAPPPKAPRPQGSKPNPPVTLTQFRDGTVTCPAGLPECLDPKSAWQRGGPNGKRSTGTFALRLRTLAQPQLASAAPSLAWVRHCQQSGSASVPIRPSSFRHPTGSNPPNPKPRPPSCRPPLRQPGQPGGLIVLVPSHHDLDSSILDSGLRSFRIADRSKVAEGRV